MEAHSQVITRRRPEFPLHCWGLVTRGNLVFLWPRAGNTQHIHTHTHTHTHSHTPTHTHKDGSHPRGWEGGDHRPGLPQGWVTAPAGSLPPRAQGRLTVVTASTVPSEDEQGDQ